jgi:hypothetical protein
MSSFRTSWTIRRTVSAAHNWVTHWMIPGTRLLVAFKSFSDISTRRMRAPKLPEFLFHRPFGLQYGQSSLPQNG